MTKTEEMLDELMRAIVRLNERLVKERAKLRRLENTYPSSGVVWDQRELVKQLEADIDLMHWRLDRLEQDVQWEDVAEDAQAEVRAAVEASTKARAKYSRRERHPITGSAPIHVIDNSDETHYRLLDRLASSKQRSDTGAVIFFGPDLSWAVEVE